MELPNTSLDILAVDTLPRATKSAGKRPPNRRTFPTPPANRPVVLDYWELTKPEISFLVAISALAGFLLGAPGDIAAATLCFTMLGTALASGGGGVLNHFLERVLDMQMRRTANRPLPTGRISANAALIFGLLLCVTGVGILFTFVNTLTAALATLTILLYLFVYTPLKRHTKYNTLVGTIPGALPALGGWTAATGGFGAGGWAMFAILALWQMPHFLSLAWMYRKDYARAGYAMLTVVEPDGTSTARQTLLFTALLGVVSVLPTVVGVTGWLYLVGAIVLSIRFLVPAYAFYRSRTTRDARRVLLGSVLYIPLLVILIVVDRLV